MGMMYNTCLLIEPRAFLRPKLTFSYLVRITVSPTQKSKTKQTNKNKLRGLSPQANYTDRATAACRRSQRIEGVAWSEQRIPTAVFSVF
jgi:hypothetical protein